ncbi:unnamed protein product [Paramecium octaurelia]|uniref:Nucleoporin Nup159/Nup146 N-terminal domain-containing protein n=1 Tax=Paramecium octaurelia TaxID=43137 RepID=A0A8S1UIM0_PAROT|nr:unnamed protein product [Paramecium octaurelia]
MQQDSKNKKVYYQEVCHQKHQNSKILSVKFVKDDKNIISIGKDDHFIKLEQQNKEWILKEVVLENQQLQCCTFSQALGSFVYAHKKGQIDQLSYNQEQDKWVSKTIRESEGNQILELQLNTTSTRMVQCLYDFAVALEYQNQEWIEISSLNETFTEDECIFTTSVSFNRDSQEIAIGFTDGHISIWKQINNEWQIYQRMELHQGSITKVRFSSSKDILVGADQKGNTIIWEKNQQTQKYELQCQYQSEKTIEVIYFNLNSSILLIGEGSQVRIMKQLKDNKWVFMQTIEVKDLVSCIDISNDNKQLVVGQNNGFVSVFEYVGQ